MSGWLTPGDWSALATSLRLALISTALLLVLCTPCAWWLAVSRSRLRPFVEAVTTLPLVLPPTVLGFYLLGFLGPRGWGGMLGESLFGAPLAFSFTGLVIGSTIYSLPFVLQPLQTSFQATGTRVIDVAATLRASPLDAFFHVVVPLARRGYLSAAVLAFAHTLGEFGVILMIGGNIPGRTQVASIALFNHVEAVDYQAAQRLALTLLLLCFALLLTLFLTNRRERRVGVAL
jgi:molybdate transport system permease protein